MCVCNGTVIIQVLMAFQFLNIDLKWFGSIAWSVSFMLAKHVSCNCIKKTKVMEMVVLYFLGGEE